MYIILTEWANGSLMLLMRVKSLISCASMLGAELLHALDDAVETYISQHIKHNQVNYNLYQYHFVYKQCQNDHRSIGFHRSHRIVNWSRKMDWYTHFGLWYRVFKLNWYKSHIDLINSQFKLITSYFNLIIM